jgi:hypothetical protein
MGIARTASSRLNEFTPTQYLWVLVGEVSRRSA